MLFLVQLRTTPPLLADDSKYYNQISTLGKSRLISNFMFSFTKDETLL